MIAGRASLNEPFVGLYRPMSDEIFKTTRFRILTEAEAKERPLYKKDLEEIIEDFKTKKVACRAFSDYCEAYKSRFDAGASEEGFREELTASLDKYLEHGIGFYWVVLEELMKRHGVPVDWS